MIHVDPTRPSYSRPFDRRRTHSSCAGNPGLAQVLGSKLQPAERCGRTRPSLIVSKCLAIDGPVQLISSIGVVRVVGNFCNAC